MKAALIALSLATAGVSAQTLKALQLDTATAQTGQNVTATLDFAVGDKANCGVRVQWGDGVVTEVRIEEPKQVPFKLSHVYARAGDYTVIANPGKVKSSLGCVGKKVTAMVKVSAPPPPPAPVAAAAAAPAAKAATGPSCPDNWTLNAKSVVKKTGAYTCTAKAGTALPEKKPACPGDLTYFENGKKGMLGCRVG